MINTQCNYIPIAGIIFGAIFTYAIEEEKPKRYQLLTKECQDAATTVALGDTIIIRGTSEERYFCSIKGKVYEDNDGNDIQESVKYWKWCM